MTNAPTPNWESIRAQYEAGAVSIRELARRHDISDTAIRKRATAEGWAGSHHGSQPVQPEIHTEVQTTVRTISGPGDAFSWADNPDILLHQRGAIAVYLNPYDQIVIREEAPYPEDDHWVRIDQRDVPALCRRLQELCEGTGET